MYLISGYFWVNLWLIVFEINLRVSTASIKINLSDVRGCVQLLSVHSAQCFKSFTIAILAFFIIPPKDSANIVVLAMFSLAGNYILKFHNKNTGLRCEICSKLTTKTPEQCHWCRSGVFIVDFEHISHFSLVFLLLTLSR